MDGRLPVREEKKERRGGRARRESGESGGRNLRGTWRLQLNRRSFRRALGLILALLQMTAGAAASGSWHTLTEMEKAENLAGLVTDYTGEIRITFLGDCTLGGEESSRNSRLGFAARIAENGMVFPFRNLTRLTKQDDLTVANLEGVLTDRKLKKVEKKYNFSGPTAYTEILTSGGIDCVTLANNHSHDNGEEGYQDTREALETAGVGWFGTDAPGVWRSDEGLMIGFVGVSWSLTGSRFHRYEAQVEALKAMGCAAVITVMHTGEEYSYEPPSPQQRQVAERAAACGSALVIGHHPHVVQGFTTVSGMPVVYSLGNCSFGGTTRAKDSDALAVQAVLCFVEGELRKTELHFHPLSMTSDPKYNNYSPRLLEGEEAERVLRKMEKSTGNAPGPWSEGAGAVAVWPAAD